MTESTRPLPTPTRNVEVAKQDMDDFGYALIADALSPEQVRALTARLLERAKEEAKAAGGELDVESDTSTARVMNVMNKGSVWQAILDPSDVVHQVLEHVFNPCFNEEIAVHGRDQKYLLSSSGAKFKHRDTWYQQRDFHTDQKWAAGHQDYPLVCTTFYALSDFNVENGCTWVVPGSHKVPSPPLRQYYERAPEMLKKAVPFVAPAGTCCIFEGRTWHAEGVNTSGEIRMHLNGYHCAPYIRQRELFSMNLRQDVIDELSDAQLKLLGFDSSLLFNVIEPTLGRKNVGYMHPELAKLRS